MTTDSPEDSALDLIPPVEDSDPEEVATALETAHALGRNGDLREALRWLRRASEAADDAGRDQRSLALARSAADLANRLTTETAPPPAVAPSPPPPVAAEPSSPAPASLRPLPPSARRPSLPSPSLKPSVTPAPPSVAPRPPSVASRAPSVSPRPSLPPSVSPSAPKASPSITPAPVRTVSKTPMAPRVSTAPPPTVSKPAKPSYTTPQALLGPEGNEIIERLLREGRAEAVSIKRSARDPSLFVARSGSAHGGGARRAVIVLLEDAPDFFADR